MTIEDNGYLPEEATPVVALWLWTRGNREYRTYESVASAIESAFWIEEQSDDSILDGVQFVDGHLIEIDDWQALTDFSKAKRAEQRRREHQATYVPQPTRTITDPFTGEELTVRADAPAWLGALQPKENP